MYTSNRIPSPSIGKIESIDIDEVCYIFRIPGSEHLHIELFSFEKGEYYSHMMEYTSLTKFMDMYSDTGYFLRCHKSYIVSKKMVKSFSRMDSQLIMLMSLKNGNDVRIDVSQTYKKQVSDALKGLY